MTRVKRNSLWQNIEDGNLVIVVENIKLEDKIRFVMPDRPGVGVIRMTKDSFTAKHMHFDVPTYAREFQ